MGSDGAWGIQRQSITAQVPKPQLTILITADYDGRISRLTSIVAHYRLHGDFATGIDDTWRCGVRRDAAGKGWRLTASGPPSSPGLRASSGSTLERRPDGSGVRHGERSEIVFHIL